MKLSVIIPTHNRAHALDLTLSNLAEQQFDHAWEVIVVNNRCTDDTDAIVSRRKFPVPLQLVHEDIPGPAAARNAGAERARGQYLLFIDNDILVERDFLQSHLDSLEAHPGAWIVGQIVNLPEQEATSFGRFRKSLFPFISPDEGIRETNSITTANLSMPREDFEALSGFDENFFVASGEDRELMIRARKNGITMLFDPSIVVVHNDWAGFTIRDYCFRHRTYMRTEPLFWRKHGDEYPRWQLALENTPPSWKKDRPSMIARKLSKQIVSSRGGQATIIGVCAVLERLWPWPPLLWRCYRLAIAGAMYKGFQEGLAVIESDQTFEEYKAALLHR
ncbi:MAG: glycosyltransferase family 2 protein [Pyrinomonadaceae bacterium]